MVLDAKDDVYRQVKSGTVVEDRKDPLLGQIYSAAEGGWELVSISDDEMLRSAGPRGEMTDPGYLLFFRRRHQ